MSSQNHIFENLGHDGKRAYIRSVARGVEEAKALEIASDVDDAANADVIAEEALRKKFKTEFRELSPIQLEARLITYLGSTLLFALSILVFGGDRVSDKSIDVVENIVAGTFGAILTIIGKVFQSVASSGSNGKESANHKPTLPQPEKR